MICLTLPIEEAALTQRGLSEAYSCIGVGAGGATKRSLILGGGALVGGPIFRDVLALYIGSGGALRSGELFPWGMLPNGTRAGIREGVLAPTADAIELANGFRLMVLMELSAPERGGGGPLRVLPLR